MARPDLPRLVGNEPESLEKRLIPGNCPERPQGQRGVFGGACPVAYGFHEGGTDTLPTVDRGNVDFLQVRNFVDPGGERETDDHSGW